METTKVFVYGTLMTGFGNCARFLEGKQGARKIADAEVTGYVMFSCGAFPAICPVGEVPDRSAGNIDANLFSIQPDLPPIKGEVWEVDESVRTNLDLLEGVPFHYRRDRAVTTDGTEVELYVYNRRSLPHRIVKNGDWRQFCKDETAKCLSDDVDDEYSNVER